jgi:hypothetical protein
MTLPETFATEPRAEVTPRIIELAIHGADLVLAGKFEHWVPVAIETGGGESEAQVLFDVTSSGPANDGGELFSYTAKKVSRLADGAYLAKGTFRAGDVIRGVEALVQAPAGHSPFASITFRLDEAAFPEVWQEFSGRLSGRGPADLEVRPRAWLLAPVLAAA